MGTTVAVKGDVQATAGSVAIAADTDSAGSWSAGPVIDTAYEYLTIGGTAVIHRSECTFTYSGGTTTPPSSSPVPVPPEMETVTLTASSTVLQSGSDYVLLDGDMEESSYGNKLEASAGAHVSSD